MHGARTADDKVAPALLGTHSNWHGLESLRAQREREDDLHGYCGLLSDDYPSDGIPEMWHAAQRAPTASCGATDGRWRSGLVSAPIIPSRRLQDELSCPKTRWRLVAQRTGSVLQRLPIVLVCRRETEGQPHSDSSASSTQPRNENAVAAPPPKASNNNSERAAPRCPRPKR